MAQSSSGTGIAETQEASLEEAQLHKLLQGEAAPQAIAGNGFTYRHDWGLKHGQWILPLTWSGFTNATRVFVAIGEGTGGGGKFVGSARYTVHNVAPDTGRVTIWVDIEWGSDISLIVDYLIIEP